MMNDESALLCVQGFSQLKHKQKGRIKNQENGETLDSSHQMICHL